MGGFTGILYGFVPAYLVHSLHYSPSETALALTTLLLVSSAGLIVAGWAGDHLPRHIILRVGTALLIVTVIPIWSLITGGNENLVLLLGALGLVFSISSGIWPSIIATLFPTRVRFQWNRVFLQSVHHHPVWVCATGCVHNDRANRRSGRARDLHRSLRRANFRKHVRRGTAGLPSECHSVKIA